ncbi:hypothetical protein [Spiroplasma endosymbiont of Poecilobothrus nobilitatus]|uniref:hypothetical protein n=1 Tax=Spiroplasma endosymbiont of Poecilobothrus nobilitatus TaxID=1209220 RepID=UPI00313D893B
MPIGIINKATQQLNIDNTNFSIRVNELEKTIQQLKIKLLHIKKLLKNSRF